LIDAPLSPDLGIVSQPRVFETGNIHHLRILASICNGGSKDSKFDHGDGTVAHRQTSEKLFNLIDINKIRESSERLGRLDGHQSIEKAPVLTRDDLNITGAVNDYHHSSYASACEMPGCLSLEQLSHRTRFLISIIYSNRSNGASSE
jgi:hypothetical protein